MKKTRNIFLIMLLLLCLWTMAACDASLDKPSGLSFDVEKQTLSWNAVKGAKHMIIIFGYAGLPLFVYRLPVTGSLGIHQLCNQGGHVFPLCASFKQPLISVSFELCVVSLLFHGVTFDNIVFAWLHLYRCN